MKKRGAENNLPAHVIVYRRIRDMILFGELEPGAPVTIHGLIERLDTGMTPVREALRRLTAEGALEFQDNRRICVPQVSIDQVEEIRRVRLVAEPLMAAKACEKMSAAQIDEIENIDADLNAAISDGNIEGYLRKNHAFHMALYAHANQEILLDISRSLWLRIGPSLRVVCGQIGPGNSSDMHKQAIQALRDGLPEAVAQAITHDIEQGHESILQNLRG